MQPQSSIVLKLCIFDTRRLAKLLKSSQVQHFETLRQILFLSNFSTSCDKVHVALCKTFISAFSIVQKYYISPTQRMLNFHCIEMAQYVSGL